MRKTERGGGGGVAYSLAAIVSTTAMRHHYWAQHKYLPLFVCCQSEDANILVICVIVISSFITPHSVH
jgi:hypothetical protein